MYERPKISSKLFQMPRVIRMSRENEGDMRGK